MSSSINLHASTSRDWARWVAALCALLLLACRGGEPAANKEPSPAEIERRLLKLSDDAIAARAAPDADPVPWEALANGLPDAVGAFKASEPAHGATDTVGGQLSKSWRHYEGSELHADIEIADAVRARNMLVAFMLQLAAARKGGPDPQEGARTLATNVGTHPALARAQSGEAVVIVAVAQRFIVTVRVRTAENEDEALRVAGALPLNVLVALAPESPTDNDGQPAVASGANGAPVAPDDP